jgi:hypothetical protein
MFQGITSDGIEIIAKVVEKGGFSVILSPQKTP